MRFDATTAERIASGRKTEHRVPRRPPPLPPAQHKARIKPNSWRVRAPELEAKGVVSPIPPKIQPVRVGQSIPVTVMQGNADLGYRRLKPPKEGAAPKALAKKERERKPRKEGHVVCHVTVVDVKQALLHEITQVQAMAEGFKTRADFWRAWWERYHEGPGLPDSPEWPIRIPVWVVRFELDPSHRARLLATASDVNHGYTESPEMAVEPEREGEGVEPEWDERFSLEAAQTRTVTAEKAQLRRERHELDQRLMRVLEDARLQGVDVSSPLRVIERQLEKIERRVYEGKAA